jgi:putative salt-induced outer membrane protein YdiY
MELAAQFTFLTTTGNASTQSLGLTGDAAYRPGPWVHSAKLGFVQLEDEGNLSARSLLALFRTARTLRERLSAYGQYDYFRDRFAGIEHRNTIEGGLSYVLVPSAVHRLVVDGGVGYQSEARLAAEDVDSATASSAGHYKWQISPTADFADDARVVLTLADIGAWRLEQAAALTAAISSIFSLKVSNTIRFVNEPVPGFERTDTITSVALVMKVRRP